MLRQRPWIRAFIVGACLGAAHCDEKKPDEVWDLCWGTCKAEFSLAFVDGDFFTNCTKGCVHMVDRAAEISESCHEHVIDLMQCVVALPDLIEIGKWVGARGTVKSAKTFEYPCRDESVKFAADCEDLWWLE